MEAIDIPWIKKVIKFISSGRRQVAWFLGLAVLAQQVITMQKPHELFFPDGQATIGLILMAFGLTLRCWALGHIVKEKQITQSGPYHYVQHPLYVGSFLLGLGICIILGNYLAYATLFLYFVLFYGSQINREEEKLLRKHKAAYLDYAERVPRFIPVGFLKAPKPGNNISFSFGNFSKNKGWPTVFAVLGLIVFIETLGKLMEIFFHI